MSQIIVLIVQLKELLHNESSKTGYSEDGNSISCLLLLDTVTVNKVDIIQKQLDAIVVFFLFLL